MMDPAFDDIAFLARSANRVEALELLTDSPHTRRELRATMDASRVTVGRIVADLTERRWATVEGDTYRTTPTGELVCREFRALRDAVDAATNLRDFVEQFPREWLGFDLRRLADATVAVPTETEPTAPVGLATEAMVEASHVRIVAQSIITEVLTVQRERAATGDLTGEAVLSESLAEAVTSENRLAERLAELVTDGSIELYRYPGSIPATFGVYDHERVGFGFVDDGRPSAGVLTDDEVVCAWAESTVDDYRERAERIRVEDLRG
jgi:predicted transcriptional regulator